MRWLVIVVAFVAGLGLAHAQDVDYATLSVRVEGIRQRPGEIGVALFNSPKGYPVHIEHAYETEWAPLTSGQDSVEVTFEGLAVGEYAVSVVHDENGNRTLERSILGFPKEGVGFSNDQKVVLSAPKFGSSKFPLSAGERKNIVITLDYRA